jgi:hypothetical protein
MDFNKDKARAAERFAAFLRAASATHPRRADAESRMKELAPKPAPAPPLKPGGAS